MQKQSGFTLIELIMVIVILGILAAMALPKFADVSSEAQTNADDYEAAASASAADYSVQCQVLKVAGGATAASAAAACAP